MLMLSRSKGGIGNTELTPWTPDFQSLVNELSAPTIGTKDGSYFLRCAGTRRSNADTSDIANVLILDGDKRINEDGEMVAGAPDPAKVHKVLTRLNVTHLIYSSHSNASQGDSFYKYRAVIPCTYTPEQLPALLDYLFSELHKEGVMLADVKENRTWSQPWYFPRVPDESRQALFKFFQHEGITLDVEPLYQAWLNNQPAQPEPEYKPYKPQPNEGVAGWRDPIAEFNQTYSVHDVLIRNGYIQKGAKYMRHGSESKTPGVQVCINCKDGVERVFSHGGDVLNDGFSHDAFDVFSLLEHDGDISKALNWSDDITKNNQRLHMQSQADSAGIDVDDDKALAFSFPTFNPAKFYGIAGEVALLASEESEADPMAVYVSFLAAMAAMLGRHKYIQVGESRHYARLFTVLVGASSRARKGTSFKPVIKVIRKAEDTYKQRNTNPLFTDYLVIADGGLSSAEGLIFKVRDESEETDKRGNPLHSAIDDKRLLVVEEELANVLKISQREGNTLSPLLRKCWDGGTLAPMTKNNRLTATDPHINALGHITQFELKHLMSDSDLHNGLSNRFLWVCVRRTKKLAFPKPMDSDKVFNIAIRLSGALKKSELEALVELTPDARQFWGLQYHIVSADKPGLLGSITSRSEAYVLRLSLLFCLLDGLDAIEVKHMQAAIDLIEFCNESVEFIFSTPADSDEGTDADKLLNALADKPLTQTEVSKLFNGHKNRRDLSTMLTDLQALNKIKSNKQPGSKTILWQKI